MLMDILYAFEKLWVEAYIIGMAGKYRAHLLSQCFHVVIAFGTEKIEENSCRAVEQVIIVSPSFDVILRDDSVLKGRLVGIIDNFLDLLVLTAYAFHHCFLIIAQFYLVEWDCVMWSIIWLKKWIYVLFVL